MTAIDYTVCPAGCPLKHFRHKGESMGFRYGCLGGKTGDARYAAPWAAWVCQKAWLAYRAMVRTGQKIPTDPTAVTETINYRVTQRYAR